MKNVRSDSAPPVLAFIVIFAVDVAFPLIVVAAGLIGYLGSRITSDSFKAGGHHASAYKSYGPALIDNDTPIPDHLRFKWTWLLLFACMGLLVWATVIKVLTASYGWTASRCGATGR